MHPAAQHLPTQAVARLRPIVARLDDATAAADRRDERLEKLTRKRDEIQTSRAAVAAELEADDSKHREARVEALLAGKEAPSRRREKLVGKLQALDEDLAALAEEIARREARHDAERAVALETRAQAEAELRAQLRAEVIAATEAGLRILVDEVLPAFALVAMLDPSRGLPAGERWYERNLSVAWGWEGWTIKTGQIGARHVATLDAGDARAWFEGIVERARSGR